MGCFQVTALLVVALAAAGGRQCRGHASGYGGWAVVEMFQRQPLSSNVAALLAKRNRRPWCLTSESSRRFHRERKARKLIVDGASVDGLDSGGGSGLGPDSANSLKPRVLPMSLQA